MSDLGHDDGEGTPGAERWMVSFADFMTLMFALFTVLYATSNRDVEKTKEFQESVKRFLIKAGAFGGSGEKVNQGEKFNSVIEPPIQTYNQGSPLSQDTYDEVEKFIEDQLTKEERSNYVIDIGMDEIGVRLVLAAKAIYSDSSIKFKPEAMKFIDHLGELIAKIGRNVLVEAHLSDQTAITNQFESPWEFSGARATALTRFFIKRQKMSPAMFVPISFGTSRPLSEKNPKNERIEIVLLTEALPI